MHIVAECGSNHCQSKDLALEHIRVAKDVGATAVKFQLFVVNKLDSRPDIQAKLKPYELPPAWLPELRDCAHKHDLHFIVTPFDIESCHQLNGLVDMVKISAYDLTYHDLIAEAAKLGVPVILSTAMATMREIQVANGIVWDRQKAPPYILHGVAEYPARLDDCNLAVLRDDLDTTWRWGLSDHTIGSEAAVIGTALGMSCIEKHFRLNTLAPADSPDFTVSSTPRQFKHMVNMIRLTEKALGTGKKNGPLECEMELFETCRRSNSKTVRG